MHTYAGTGTDAESRPHLGAVEGGAVRLQYLGALRVAGEVYGLREQSGHCGAEARLPRGGRGRGEQQGGREEAAGGGRGGVGGRAGAAAGLQHGWQRRCRVGAVRSTQRRDLHTQALVSSGSTRRGGRTGAGGARLRTLSWRNSAEGLDAAKRAEMGSASAARARKVPAAAASSRGSGGSAARAASLPRATPSASAGESTAASIARRPLAPSALSTRICAMMRRSARASTAATAACCAAESAGAAASAACSRPVTRATASRALRSRPGAPICSADLAGETGGAERVLW